jgi:hypothetical protein
MRGAGQKSRKKEDGMKTIPWFGIALIAVCGGADAQTIHKCVGKDGKTSYSNAACPGSKEIAPAADAANSSARPVASGAAAIPQMQAGKWKLRITSRGTTKDNEMCGDPIDGFSKEVQAYAATTKWGCTMTTTPTGPRSVRLVYDCPSDRSPEGRPVSQGRSEMSVVSASPQAFRIEMTSTVYPGYVMEGTRIGECP